MILAISLILEESSEEGTDEEEGEDREREEGDRAIEEDESNRLVVLREGEDKD